MVSLEEQLEIVNQEESRILEKIDKRNSRRTIKCNGCDGSHKIKDLDAIQTHWYTPPAGCTGGDYWNEGDLHFICPETGIINRLYFHQDVHWEEKINMSNDPNEQFKGAYKGLFKNVEDVYREKNQDFVNNYYVNRNRKKFGLMEK